MSDESKKPPGRRSRPISAFPGGGPDDELSAEFDAWDRNFDSILTDEDEAAERDVTQAGPLRPSRPLQDPAAARPDVAGGRPASPAASPVSPASQASQAAGDADDDPLAGLADELEMELEFELELGSSGQDGDVGGADDIAIGEPRALGGLLGTSTLPPPIDLDDIEDGDADNDALPPFFDPDGDRESAGSQGESGAPTLAAAQGRVRTSEHETDDGQQVLTSARRPATEKAAQGAARPRANVEDGPGSAAVRAATGMAFEPLDDDDDDDFDPFADPAEDASSQVTKVIEVDESLLASAVAPEEERKPRRRKPAIVRRDELERLRQERAAHARANPAGDEDDDEAFGSQDTAVIDEEQLESLAGAAAASGNDEPAITVALDEDFYDDISIDESGAASVPADPVFEPATPSVRRVSRHVVRREAMGKRKAQAPRPVVRTATRKRQSDADMARQLEVTREADPESTLDLRTAVDGSLVAGAPGGGHRGREAEIQAIIDKAAEALRSQKAGGGAPGAAGPAPAATVRSGTLGGGAEPAAGTSWDEPEWEMEDAWEGEASAPGTRPMLLDDVDVLPDLPPAKLPTTEPELDLAALEVPEQAEALTAAELNTRSEEMAAQLLLYERELALVDDDARTARLCLEAGRLAERLGDLDRARSHYQDALRADPRLGTAMRALRRIERALGNWDQALAYLDTELSEAAQLERRALRALRTDILMARGERDQARAAVDELLAEAPGDVRALLVRMELAFLDGRHDELVGLLDRLAGVVADRRLRGALHRIRGRVLERVGTRAQAADAFAEAAANGSMAALLAATRDARAQGDRATAVALAGRLSEAATGDLAARDPGFVAALWWRRAIWAEAAGHAETHAEAHWQALAQAAAHAPDQSMLLAELGAAARRRGDDETAARAFLHLGEVAPSAVEQAVALVRAAEHLVEPLGRDAEAVDALRRAQRLDSSNPHPAIALERIFERSGDVDALIELDLRAAAAEPAGAVLERVRAASRLIETGRHDQAIAELEAGRQVVDAPVFHEVLDRALARAGRIEERAALLTGLLDSPGAVMDPDTALVRAARASEVHAHRLIAEQSALIAAGEEPGPAAREACAQAVAAALEGWNRVLATDPDSVVAHAATIRLGEVLSDPDILDEALARAYAATIHSGRAVTLALRRVEILAARPERAEPGRIEDTLREAWSLSPHDPRTALRLLVLAAAGQRLADAAAVLEDRAAALPAGGESVALWYRAAALMLDPADEPAQAAELLERVRAARPGFAPAAELLRAARRRMGDTSPAVMEPEAGTMAPRLLGGDDFARLVREAEAYQYRAGDMDQALALYAQALALRPADPLVRDGLTRAAEAASSPESLIALVQHDLQAAEARREDAASAALDDVVGMDIAEAREELARIDSELRGDTGAAVTHLQAALAADPGRPSVVRALERAYVSEQRWAELLALYDAHLPEPVRETVPWLLARARLAERLAAAGPIDHAAADPAEDAALAYYARAHALERGCRAALFHLEAQARAAGPSAELADLEAALAVYMAGDARAQAAFITRSGETLARIDQLELAIARFKQADGMVRDAAASPAAASSSGGATGAGAAAAGEGAEGYEAAVFAWRMAALAGALWLDVAESALREARLRSAEPGSAGGADAAADADRAALYHLAGVTLMDRVMDSERALAAFDRALALAPDHEDAFVRMRLLLQEQGAHERLAALLARRIEVEREPAVRARLHRDLAALYRESLGDLERAREHLRAVQALAPDDMVAVAALADIAWEQGAWEEAAEGLLARARVETDVRALEQIFFRLGVIYTERLPDPALAIKSFKRVLRYDGQNADALDHLSRLGMEIGDWKLALAACERLLSLPADDEVRVARFHRLGQIHRDGFDDPSRAERAYRMALDQAPTSDAALAGLVRLFEERGDLRSLRMHLDRVIGTMRLRLDEDVRDGTAYRVIARTMRIRQQAQVAGSLATARCAAELAVLLGAGEAEERAIIAEAVADERGRGARGLARLQVPELDTLWYPPEASHALRQVFALLGDRVAKHVGIDLRRYDVGRGDRVRGREHPAVAVIEAVAAEMGMEAPVIYVSQKHATVMVGEPTSPISVVLGADVVEAAGSDQARLRFVAGRVLRLALTHLAIPARMPPTRLGELLVALLRLFEPELDAPGVDARAVDMHLQRLRRLIPGSLMQELSPFALGLAGEHLDPVRIQAGIEAMGNRAGLLACGSVEAAVAVLRAAGAHEDMDAASSDPDIAALMRFSVSEDHAMLRGLLDE